MSLGRHRDRIGRGDVQRHVLRQREGRLAGGAGQLDQHAHLLVVMQVVAHHAARGREVRDAPERDRLARLAGGELHRLADRAVRRTAARGSRPRRARPRRGARASPRRRRGRRSSAWNSSLRATKSVSQLSSIMAADAPPSSSSMPMRPCEAVAAGTLLGLGDALRAQELAGLGSCRRPPPRGPSCSRRCPRRCARGAR